MNDALAHDPVCWLTRVPGRGGERTGSGACSRRGRNPTMTGPAAVGVIDALGRWARTLEDAQLKGLESPAVAPVTHFSSSTEPIGAVGTGARTGAHRALDVLGLRAGMLYQRAISGTG